ncbi:dna-directed rna polymerases and iii kda polypeptide [Phaffia rhodozyma]|uniref:DNA-directed RNA polymerases I, II, and III subunit RPABC3 n=1 Tax=Phaffia rhodozyma TaxID=264483 RepID=A0A0F7SRW4_PHARH|nr:dna-directed rna polymerases and iii kda polypeptide [Phaffia rhodozyma]
MSGDGKLFDDLFVVSSVDKGGKKFDRVSRIEASSSALSMNLTLDINSEVFPLSVGDRIMLLLSSTLFPDEADKAEDETDGQAGESKREAWRGGEEGLAADFDYVTYGKIYKFEDVAGPEKDATVYISFGGLLMALRGSYRHLSNIVVGENAYCLIRK